jgi:hypothetical protein
MPLFKAFSEYILTLPLSDTALPENAAAEAALNSLIADFAAIETEG